VRRQLSLRSRLLLAVGGIALLALVVADVAIYASLRSYLYQQTDATLQASHVAVEAAAEGRTGPGGASQPSPDAPGQGNGESRFCSSAPAMFIEVRGVDNIVIPDEECAAFVPGEASYSPKIPTQISGFSVTAADPNEPVTYFTVPSTTAGGPDFRVRASKLAAGGVLIVAEPIGNVASTLRQLLFLEVAVTIAALLGAIALGLWLVRLGLRPLRDVVRTADSISGGDLMHRIPNANTSTEVGHVATALNVMLERIESAFGDLQASENRLRQFVSDASHELRTPIAAVSAYAQLFTQGAAERAEDLPRLMQGIERETRRMARLVEDLLLLARFDEQHAVAAEPVELVGLAAEAVETARMVGPDWPVTFVATEPVEVLGDSSALRQVIDNLLANVRAHTPRGTEADVVVGREDAMAFVEIVDNGPGISDADAATIFERFFRADPSRSRETGGAGLGLAIVASIMRAHGGRALAGPRAGGGAAFRVEMPALDPTVIEDP